MCWRDRTMKETQPRRAWLMNAGSPVHTAQRCEVKRQSRDKGNFLPASIDGSNICSCYDNLPKPVDIMGTTSEIGSRGVSQRMSSTGVHLRLTLCTKLKRPWVALFRCQKILRVQNMACHWTKYVPLILLIEPAVSLSEGSEELEHLSLPTLKSFGRCTVRTTISVLAPCRHSVLFLLLCRKFAVQVWILHGLQNFAYHDVERGCIRDIADWCRKTWLKILHTSRECRSPIR